MNREQLTECHVYEYSIAVTKSGPGPYRGRMTSPGRHGSMFRVYWQVAAGVATGYT